MVFPYVLALIAALDPAVASKYLANVDGWCESEGKKLWNKSLCGPVLIVDPATRDYVTSDRQSGKLPASMPVANTAVDWNGGKWTMLLWPLPEDPDRRKAILAHELWHRIQSDLGFAATNPTNAHLDETEGRIWLRLEARALRRALQSKGEPLRVAIGDAMAFRNRRHTMFRLAAEQERMLEMHEGLAEYTGVAITADPATRAVENLTRLDEAPSFSRSFAYATGPAFGVLLDQSNVSWRKHLKGTQSLSKLVAEFFNVSTKVDPFQSAARYDGETVRREELARYQESVNRQTLYRQLFSDGPVLVLPAAKQLNFSFDPNKQFPAGSMGTVYEGMQVSDSWGSIEIKGHGLISSDYQRLLAPKPDATGLAGEGWALTLAEGWSVVPGRRAGDWTVSQAARDKTK